MGKMERIDEIFGDEQHAGIYWVVLMLSTFGGAIVIYLMNRFLVEIGLHDPVDPPALFEVGEFKVVQFGTPYNLLFSWICTYALFGICGGQI